MNYGDDWFDPRRAIETERAVKRMRREVLDHEAEKRRREANLAERAEASRYREAPGVREARIAEAKRRSIEQTATIQRLDEEVAAQEAGRLRIAAIVSAVNAYDGYAGIADAMDEHAAPFEDET